MAAWKLITLCHSALLKMISAKAAISACERLGTNSAWIHYFMKCVASACARSDQLQWAIVCA
eukprot:507325-Karenia_brevis.AAC.1